MTIQRLKSPYYVPSPGQQTAYLQSPVNATTSSFVSIGQAGTIAGLTYRTHVFAGGTTGTLYFSSGGFIDVLAVGSGGSGGSGRGVTQLGRNYGGGGGGAGGLLISYNLKVDTTTAYSFTVGNTTSAVSNGSSTTFGPLTAVGGGRGGTEGSAANSAGQGGGSGGGAAYDYQSQYGGVGLPVLGQGNRGGGYVFEQQSFSYYTGGGGGYVTAGLIPNSNIGGAGGSGINVNFDGTVRPLCAGGGAGGTNGSGGGVGGTVDGVETGGRGGLNNATNWATAFNGSVPTAIGCGGGGGGSYMQAASDWGTVGGNASAGILIIRYVVNQ